MAKKERTPERASAAPIVAGINARNRALALGASGDVAMQEAVRESAATALVGGTVAATIGAAAKAMATVAPRIAPALGPVGWAAAAGMAAYGGYRGYQNSGTWAGAAKGAIGLDTTPGMDSTTAGLAKLQQEQIDRDPAAAGAKPPGTGKAPRPQAAVTGPVSRDAAKKFEAANAEFSGDRAAQSQQTASVDGEKPKGGPRGFANPNAQFAAQTARGVKNFSDWAQSGNKTA
jgi:hypothetical protein